MGLISDSNTQDIVNELNSIQGLSKAKPIFSDDVLGIRYFHSNIKQFSDPEEQFFLSSESAKQSLFDQSLFKRDFISFKDEDEQSKIIDENELRNKDPLEFS